MQETRRRKQLSGLRAEVVHTIVEILKSSQPADGDEASWRPPPAELRRDLKDLIADPRAAEDPALVNVVSDLDAPVLGAGRGRRGCTQERRPGARRRGSVPAGQSAANVQRAGAMTGPIGASTLQLAIGAALLLVLAGVAGSLGAFDLLGGCSAASR